MSKRKHRTDKVELETCYYCGKNISIFASNPHEGCPVPLMHRDEPGKMKWHHLGCVMDRLIENQPPSPAARHAEGGQLDRVIQECEEYQNAYRAFRALSVWGKTDYKPLDDADKELALSVYRRAQRGDKNTLHNDLTRLLCAAEGDDLIQVVRTIIEQRDKAILESSTSPDSVVVPREPTKEMLIGMSNATFLTDGSMIEMHRRYNGMLGAVDALPKEISMADPEVIYEGGYFPSLAPYLYVDMNKDSRTFGWLMAKHPDGQWVTLANLKPLAARICADRA